MSGPTARSPHEHPHHSHQHGPRLVRGVGWLRTYDLASWWAKVPAAYAELVTRLDLTAGERVLEVGCGTGNLLLRAARAAPVTAVGLDPDPKALRTLRRKAARAGLAIGTDVGAASPLPYADDSVDRVLSALMFHHVTPADRPAALAEVARVLVPGGRFELVDLDVDPTSARRRVRRIARHHDLEQDLPSRLREAGFAVTVHPPLVTRFAPLTHLTARTAG